MVFLSSILIASSVVISSLTPGAEAAVIPLPLQRRGQRPLMRDNTFVDGYPKQKRGLVVSPNYDPNHSQHWNYHHGLVNKDGHGHGMPHKRSDGSVEFKKEHHVHQSNNKKQPSVVPDIALKVTVEKRHGDHGHWDEHGHWHEHHHHHEREIDERHHHEHGHDHNHEHWHRSVETRQPHDHDHDHEHGHEHDHEHHRRSGHVTGEHHKDERKPAKKGKKGSSGAKKGGKKGSSTGAKEEVAKKPSIEKSGEKKSEGGEKKENDEKKNDKRNLPASGVPGFVEVATQFFNSTLSRSIAGLVYTSNPDTSANATAFILGTSTVESTEFYLTQSPHAPINSTVNVVNIRIPILNSQELTATDYCATFDLAPPSPLSLLPCGDLSGFSQNFAYNETTSELQPLYSLTPAPMALVANPSESESANTPSNGAQSFASTNGTSSEGDDTDAPAQSISLFFVPASTYYQAPVAIPELFDADSPSSTALPTSTVPATFSTMAPSSASFTSAPSSTLASQATPIPTSDASFSTSASSAFVDGQSAEEAQLSDGSPIAPSTATQATQGSLASPTTASLASPTTASFASPTPASLASPTSASLASPTDTPASSASPSTVADLETDINTQTDGDSDSVSTSTVTLTMATEAPASKKLRFAKW